MARPAGVEGPLTKALATEGASRLWGSKLLDVLKEKMPPQIENITRTLPARTLPNGQTLPEITKVGRTAQSQLKELIKPELQELGVQREWEELGLEAKTKAPKLQKQELVSEVERNLPKLEDVVLGGPRGYIDNQHWSVEIGDAIRRGDTDEVSRLRGTLQQAPKYTQWQEPGGTDYVELFVTAPSTPEPTGKILHKHPSGLNFRTDPARGPLTPNVEAALRESGYKPEPETVPKYSWRDQHDYPDIENPVVRLRMNSRTSADGKKVLFIEEMQPVGKEQLEKAPPWVGKFWADIGMKRALRYAAENGFDEVAWTPGEVQTKRYDLSKHIREIRYQWAEPTGYYAKTYGPGAGYWVKPIDVHGNEVPMPYSIMNPKQLEETLVRISLRRL